MFVNLRFPTKQQNLIWLKRRQKVRPSVLAEELNVSRPFISKAQRIAETRIRKLLRHAAEVNRIKLHNLSPRFGFAIGYSPGLRSTTYIVYSPKLGIQTWYAHRGNCTNCDSKTSCEETLWQLSLDWQIPLQEGLSPSDNAHYLFTRIQEDLGWKEKRLA